MKCAHCGIEFEKRKHNQVYCSPACVNRANRARRAQGSAGGKRYTCVGCGNEFLPRQSGRTKYCSRGCAFNHKQAKPKPVRAKACEVCGALFSIPNGKKYCGKECRAVAAAAVSMANGYKRRAIVGRNTAEPITLIEIGERDGWTCGLCHGHVDRCERWPDRGSPSLDHIVPISKGGLHVRSNIQLAHLGCNWTKGNRTGEIRKTSRVCAVPSAV